MDPTNLTFAGACLYSLIGFAIVFVALIALMVIINIMAKVVGTGKKKEAAAPASAPAPVVAAPAPVAAAPVAAAPVAGTPAPGTAGQIKLYTVSDKEAAMIMAIVASKMNKPLNELRFKSIKEVK